MYPGVHLSLRLRTLCTRSPLQSITVDSLILRPCMTRHAIGIHRSIHLASPSRRLLRNAENKSPSEPQLFKAQKPASSSSKAAPDTTTTSSSSAATATAAPASVKKKKTLWQKVKDEATHYWDGTKLLGLEIRISSKLTWKLLNGGYLTRREARQVLLGWIYLMHACAHL